MNKEKTIRPFQNEELRKGIIKKTKGELFKCFSCGTCTASCPVATISNFNPRKIINKILLGLDVSEDIWICVSCYTCNARCPNGIDIAKVMDALRIEAQKGKDAEKQPSVIFNKAFLDTVEKNGRLYELGMMMKFNISTHRPLKDIGLFPSIMRKGKMSLSADKVKNVSEVRDIFKKVREIEERE